jgi:hypothetical protein
VLSFTSAKPGLRRPSSPLWLTLGLSALLAAGCGGRGSRTAERSERPEGSPAAEALPEDAWLDEVGVGQAQNARVCARGARDRVAQTLCGSPRPPISGLEELYAALRLTSPKERRVAAATHSLSLSVRTVSGANPRVMVLANNDVEGGLSYEGVVATAFARGEQLVELVALDPTTYEYNFYLLRFAQECNASRCTPEDLLTSRVERDWTDWTLYADTDLEDTPLDCLSCHRPFGRDTHKLLLMRQDLDPWMHWSDFRVFDENMCPTRPPEGVPAKVIVSSEGIDLVASLEGKEGKYAGIPIAELVATKSGDVMTDFLVDAENLITASPLPPHPYAQLSLRTRETVCERYYTGKSPSWDADRATSRARGLPFPYYGPDVLDPAARSQLASRTSFLESQSREDPFDVLAALLGADVPTAVGFAPRESDSAPEILQGMCGRCHTSDANPKLRRSRFDAAATENVAPSTFREVRTRLTLPASSPAAMPPRRAGTLPAWAVERVLDYLAARCSEPDACR